MSPDAVPDGTNDPLYEWMDPDDCEHCGDPWDEEPIEHVEGRPGWKCMTCNWWNWLRGVSA